MSLNQSMSIPLGSMKNNQYALSVVSHNIANLNTEGYTKQRVNFSESRNPTNSNNVFSIIQSMAGANVDSLAAYTDNSGFKNVINSNTDAQYYNTLADSLNQLENIADDLGDNGLNSLLNKFFTASSNLEQFPTDLSMRQQYVMALQDVCDKFNYISNQYDNVLNENVNNASESVSAVNSLLSNIATLNNSYIKNQASSIDNEIKSSIEELSNYLNVSYDKNNNGTYNIYVAGFAVVQGSEQLYNLQSSYDSSNTNSELSFSLKSIKNPSEVITDGINESITSGSLKAKIEFLNGTNGKYSNINDMKNAIDSAAVSFIQGLNAIQTYKNDTDETYAAYLTTVNGELVLAADSTDPTKVATPPDILVGTNAGNISINSVVSQDPYYISCARIDLNKYKDESGTIDPNWIKSVGNSDNASEMTDLQNQKICSLGSGTNNATLSQFLINNAAKNGMDAASADNKAELYQGIADEDLANYSNATGVNLDEELADMIKYQRAFEASARVFSAVNDMLGIILNMA